MSSSMIGSRSACLCLLFIVVAAKRTSHPMFPSFASVPPVDGTFPTTTDEALSLLSPALPLTLSRSCCPPSCTPVRHRFQWHGVCGSDRRGRTRANFGKPRYDYDLVVIGAGASGMFAAGSASGAGFRTLLVEKVANVTDNGCYAPALAPAAPPSFTRSDLAPSSNATAVDLYVGGDCTNAACVPSKAIRSVARLAATATRAATLVAVGNFHDKVHVDDCGGGGDGGGGGGGGGISVSEKEEVDAKERRRRRRFDDGWRSADAAAASRWLSLARLHADRTVASVRARESPARLASLPNLDLVFASDCHFESNPERGSGRRKAGLLSVTPYDDASLSSSLSSSSPETEMEGKRARGDANGEGEDGTSDESIQGGEVRANKSRFVTARRFLVAVGSSPIVPPRLAEAADRCGVPWFTYRSVLRPRAEGASSSSTSSSASADGTWRSGGIWSLLDDRNDKDDADAMSTNGGKGRGGGNAGSDFLPQIVIAGGGATACELGQALARLGEGGWDVTIVAPSILPSEDVELRRVAIKLLSDDKVTIVLGRRVADVVRKTRTKSGAVVMLDDGSSLPVSALLLCLGRSPDSSLMSLNLSAIGATWTPGRGIDVDRTLRSQTANNVYACGDCASSVPPRDRRAAHAGWTGFHAARNALAPRALGGPAVHKSVPRVIYTDPELGAAGMTEMECVAKYGAAAAGGGGGFASLSAPEKGTDRSDAETVERHNVDGSGGGNGGIGFVSLRANTGNGAILGGAAAGPAAAEIVNEMSLCVSSGLTVRDLARSIHSYPSHGYLLYRVALALAMSSVEGLLAGCGTVGRVLAALSRAVRNAALAIRLDRAMLGRSVRRRRRRRWEAEGCDRVVVLKGPGASAYLGGGNGTAAVLAEGFSGGEERMRSFLEVYRNETLLASILEENGSKSVAVVFGRGDFVRWFSEEPE